MQHIARATRLATRAEVFITHDPRDPLPQRREVIPQSIEAGGVFASRGRTAIMIESLCTSMPR